MGWDGWDGWDVSDEWEGGGGGRKSAIGLFAGDLMRLGTVNCY